MSSNAGGLWTVRIRAKGVNLWLPVPLYVVSDLLASMEDLCELVLPRLGHVNYARELRGLLAAVGAHMREPLVDIETEDVRVLIKRNSTGGIGV